MSLDRSRTEHGDDYSPRTPITTVSGKGEVAGIVMAAVSIVVE